MNEFVMELWIHKVIATHKFSTLLGIVVDQKLATNL